MDNTLDRLLVDPTYRDFLAEVKKRYQLAQLKAARSVNSEVVHFYWGLGREIIERRAEAVWGSRFLDQLSADLQVAFPGSRGFSVRNLKYMRKFAELYPTSEIGQQAAAQLPWGHLLVLMDKIKEPEARNWYASNSLTNGISRNVLVMQIEQDLYGRQGKSSGKVSNFKEHLPEPQSDLAIQMLKNPYNFDFLTVGAGAHEREIEGALTQHISKFLLELGSGFAFMGNQFKITVDDDDYFLDMLFYHVKLKCYVVIELKATAFKAEHTGKLNFYLAAVDNVLKSPQDNPTIGLLLCKSRKKLTAEYALRNVSSPIGISEYQLMKELPEKLATNLPSIEELEAELSEADSSD